MPVASSNSISFAFVALLRKRALRFPVGFLLLLLFMEVGLRAALGLGNPILYDADSAYGYFMRPNQHTRRLLARTNINSRGMRCPEFNSHKPSGTLRLMFLGDSITYGTTQVDQQDIFVELVRKNLSMDIHRPVEEINASTNGWAIENEYDFVSSRGTYNSDYVLMVLNSGDPTQPFSTLAEVQNAFTTAPGTAIEELSIRLFSRSRADAGTAVENAPEIEQRNLQLLTRVVKIVRTQGSEFVLIFVPIRRAIAQGAGHSVPQALKKWADAQNVRLFDLTDALSMYETRSITLHDGIHFNERGNRLIADSLERHFAALYFAKGASTEDGANRTSAPEEHQ